MPCLRKWGQNNMITNISNKYNQVILSDLDGTIVPFKEKKNGPLQNEASHLYQ